MSVSTAVQHPILAPLPLPDLGRWRLRRAWPRSVDHLLLELVDDDGVRVAAQWFADADRARSVAARTPGSSRTGSVVLQPDGADRKLLRLTELVRAAGHQLIAHRPERRAVVRTAAGYLKLVRPGKVAPTVWTARSAAGLDVGAPQVLEVDPIGGAIITETLPGVPLTDRLAGAGVEELCATVGRLLARLHAVPPERVPGLAEHGPAQERAVLRRWTGLAEAYGVLQRQPEPSVADSGRRVLVHRDFHDGQLLVDGGDVRALDFDLLAVGDPALDVANFLAQLELRSAQGVLPDAESAGAAFLSGYRPDAAVSSAVPGYLATARARLQAVYAFRNPEIGT